MLLLSTRTGHTQYVSSMGRHICTLLSTSSPAKSRLGGAAGPLLNSGPTAGKQEQQDKLCRARSQSAMSTASMPMLNGSPSLRATHYMPRGSMRPSSWHIHSDTFAAWPYMSSEYSRERVLCAEQRKQSQELQMCEQDFVVPKAALPLKGQGCFSQLEYDLNPYPVSLPTSCTGSKPVLADTWSHLC